MGIIIKVRERFGYVLVGVIALGILGFLLMDAISSNPDTFMGRGDTVGKINGDKVAFDEFNKMYQSDIEAAKLNSGQRSFDAATMVQLRNDSWDRYVSNILLQEQYEELGIQVTTDEMWELVQGDKFIAPEVRQSFTDPSTNFFDKNQVVNYIKNLENVTPEEKQRWHFFEESLKRNRLNTKYNNLIARGLYIPGWMAKDDYNFEFSSVTFNYVGLPYTSVADSEVEVTDSDLKAYLDAHKAQYESEPSRNLKFMAFNLKPSSEDSLEALKDMQDVAEKFKEAKDDSIFVRLYSETRFDYGYYPQGDNPEITDTFYTVDSGTVIGPYLDEGNYVVAKLVDRKLVPDSVKVQEIFVDMRAAVAQGNQRQIEWGRMMADSILTILKDGTDFNDVVREYYKTDTIDAKSLGWLSKDDAGNERLSHIQFTGDLLNQLIDQHKEGDYFLFVSPQNGYHIFYVEKSTPTTEAAKVGFVKKEIYPSKETERKLYSEAGKFAGKYGTAEAFNKAEEDGYQITTVEKVTKNTIDMQGIGVAREVVKWAFMAEVGEVSDVFALNNAYVVALLTGSKDKGVPTVNDLRTELTVAVTKEKKAALLLEKMKAAGAPSADLESLATNLGAEVQMANSKTIGAPSVGLESEPAVVGLALATDEGASAGPVKGNSGVYAITVVSKDSPELTDSELPQAKQYIRSKMASNVANQLLTTLRDEANVEDRRHMFYD